MNSVDGVPAASAVNTFSIVKSESIITTVSKVAAVCSLTAATSTGELQLSGKYDSFQLSNCQM